MSLLSIILWTAGAAFFFAITNYAAYTRGNNSGYTEGLLDGAKAKIRELTDGKFELDCRGDDGDE